MSTEAAAGPDPRRRPGRTGATRRKLFAAAMDLIGERGPAQVTVDEIAAAAGVAKGTVYYNFGSKSVLVGQLFEYGVDMMEERLQAGTETGDPLQALEAMVESAVDFLGEYPSFAQLWVSEMWRRPSDWHTTLTALRHRLLEDIRAAVQRLADNYPVRGDLTVDGVAAALFGAAFVVSLDRTVYSQRSRAESVAAIMTVIHGYLATGAGPRTL